MLEKNKCKKTILNSSVKIKNSTAGITLVALVITIIVLLILAGVGLTGGINAIKTANDNKLKTELSMVQHAALERYSEYKVTKNESLLVGNSMEYSAAQAVATQIGKTLINEGTYYELTPANLETIGLTKGEDTYIVNYQKGIVINETKKTTEAGDVLYLDTK